MAVVKWGVSVLQFAQFMVVICMALENTLPLTLCLKCCMFIIMDWI